MGNALSYKREKSTISDAWYFIYGPEGSHKEANFGSESSFVTDEMLGCSQGTFLVPKPVHTGHYINCGVYDSVQYEPVLMEDDDCHNNTFTEPTESSYRYHNQYLTEDIPELKNVNISVDNVANGINSNIEHKRIDANTDNVSNGLNRNTDYKKTLDNNPVDKRNINSNVDSNSNVCGEKNELESHNINVKPGLYPIIPPIVDNHSTRIYPPLPSNLGSSVDPANNNLPLNTILPNPLRTPNLSNPPLNASLSNPPLNASLYLPLNASLSNPPLNTSLSNPPRTPSLSNPPLNASLSNPPLNISLSNERPIVLNSHNSPGNNIHPDTLSPLHTITRASSSNSNRNIQGLNLSETEIINDYTTSPISPVVNTTKDIQSGDILRLLSQNALSSPLKDNITLPIENPDAISPNINTSSPELENLKKIVVQLVYQQETMMKQMVMGTVSQTQNPSQLLQSTSNLTPNPTEGETPSPIVSPPPPIAAPPPAAAPPPPPPPPTGGRRVKKVETQEKKELTEEELIKRIVTILAEGDMAPQKANMVAKAWVKKIKPNRTVQKIVEEYSFMITKFATNPQVVVERISIWEKELFATLDEKTAQMWRSKKRIEIEKFSKIEDIKEEIGKIKKMIEKKLAEQRDAEKAKAKAELQGQMIDELKNKIKNRVTEQGNQDDEDLQLLLDDETEIVTDF
jgi:hypothetical protein